MFAIRSIMPVGFDRNVAEVVVAEGSV